MLDRTNGGRRAKLVGAPEERVSQATSAIEAKPTGQPSGFVGRMFGALANNPYYRTYWYGNQANTLMMQMQLVANGYLAYTLTNSATALGIVSLAQGLPMFFFSPLGGAISDRFEKRDLLLRIQTVETITAAIIGTLCFAGLIQYWHLLVVAVIQGIGFSIMLPTRQGWIPHLVSREDMPNAIAVNNAGFNASRIIGPSIAGLLIAVPWFGVNGIYYIRILTFSWVLYSMLKIPITGKPEPSEKRGTLFEQMTVGYRFMLKSETLVTLFIFAFVIAMLGLCYQTLLPAFALGEFNVGSEGLGLMMTCVGVGALSGSLTMAYISRSPNKAKIQAYTGTALGLALAAFGACAMLNQFIPALVALFVVGYSIDFNTTINNTLIMLNTDKSLYGRVMAVYMMNMSLVPVSASIFGTLMDHFGGSRVFIVNGLLIAVFVICMALFHPSYKRIRSIVT